MPYFSSQSLICLKDKPLKFKHGRRIRICNKGWKIKFGESRDGHARLFFHFVRSSFVFSSFVQKNDFILSQNYRLFSIYIIHFLTERSVISYVQSNRSLSEKEFFFQVFVRKYRSFIKNYTQKEILFLKKMMLRG